MKNYLEAILVFVFLVALAGYGFSVRSAVQQLHQSHARIHEMEVDLENMKTRTIQMRGDLNAMKVRTVELWCLVEIRREGTHKPACDALAKGGEAALKFRAEHDDYNFTLGLEKREGAK